MPRSPGEVQVYCCVQCKRLDTGLSDEQPPGWRWRPVAITSRDHKTGAEKVIQARLELNCYDHHSPAEPCWENDMRDSVPKERECL